MHVVVDGRYFFAQLFPSRTLGFFVLSALYLFLGLTLLTENAFPARFFCRLDLKFRSINTSFTRKLSSNLIPIVLVTATVLTLVGVFLRWTLISRVAIDPDVADMLPLIQGACTNLMNGLNPYLEVYRMPWELPLTFWPGLWLPYLIFHFIGTDIRWLHLCVVTGIAAIVITLLIKFLLQKSQTRRATAAASLSVLFLFLFSSEFILFTGYGHTPPVWAWLSLLAASVLVKRPYLTAVFLGILIASRQTSVVFAPLLYMYWLRTYSNHRTAIKYSVVTLVVFCIVCGPFLFSAPSQFLLTPLQHYTELGEWDFTRGADSNSAKTIGFAYFLRKTQVGWLLRATMITAIAASIILAWKRIRTKTDLFLCMGFTAITVTMTSPIPWIYEYFPALILVSFAAMSAGLEDDLQSFVST
jgi:hypothetical protein